MLLADSLDDLFQDLDLALPDFISDRCQPVLGHVGYEPPEHLLSLFVLAVLFSWKRRLGMDGIHAKRELSEFLLELLVHFDGRLDTFYWLLLYFYGSYWFVAAEDLRGGEAARQRDIIVVCCFIGILRCAPVFGAV